MKGANHGDLQTVPLRGDRSGGFLTRGVVTNAALSPDQILASPRFLIGTIEQIVADLQERSERYDITYLTVFGEYVATFSPVVTRLAST
jgi:hypothetical protein